MDQEQSQAQSSEKTEDIRALELAIKRMLDDFATQYDTMIHSVAVRWRESGEGVLRHEVNIIAGRD